MQSSKNLRRKDYLLASSIATATATCHQNNLRLFPTMGLLPAPMRPIISVRQTTFKGFRAGRLSEKSYYIRLNRLLNHKIIFAEHIVCVFPENIISRFDVAVTDVVKEFAFFVLFLIFRQDLHKRTAWRKQVSEDGERIGRRHPRTVEVTSCISFCSRQGSDRAPWI